MPVSNKIKYMCRPSATTCQWWSCGIYGVCLLEAKAPRLRTMRSANASCVPFFMEIIFLSGLKRIRDLKINEMHRNRASFMGQRVGLQCHSACCNIYATPSPKCNCQPHRGAPATFAILSLVFCTPFQCHVPGLCFCLSLVHLVGIPYPSHCYREHHGIIVLSPRLLHVVFLIFKKAYCNSVVGPLYTLTIKHTSTHTYQLVFVFAS